MNAIKALAVAGLTGALAACSPASDEDPQETVSLDPAALHALLLEEADSLVPSDWQSGAPVPETALTYWHLPELDVEAARSAVCTAYPGPGNAYDCTLTFTSDNSAAEDA